MAPQRGHAISDRTARADRRRAHRARRPRAQAPPRGGQVPGPRDPRVQGLDHRRRRRGPRRPARAPRPDHDLLRRTRMTENLITLDEIDADGAIAETGAEALGTSRGDFLRRGAVGGLGLAASAGLLGGMAPVAGAAKKGRLATSDVAILNFALTLEYLEAAFYTRAVRHGHLHGDTKTFARIVARHERTHVAALKSVLKGKAVKEPKFDFK